MDGVDYIRESVEAQWAQVWWPKSPEQIRLETLEERHLMIMSQINALTKALFEANGEYWSVGQYSMGDNLGGIGQRVHSQIASLRTQIMSLEGASPHVVEDLKTTVNLMVDRLRELGSQMAEITEHHELQMEMSKADWGKF